VAILHVRRRSRWRWIAGVAAIGPALIAGVWMFEYAPGSRGAVARIPPTGHPVIGTPVRSAEADVPHPPMATPRATSSAPAGRLDFDSAEDLYALATAAVNSNDLMTLHNGRHAALACTTTPQTRAQYEALVAPGPGNEVDQERKRGPGRAAQVRRVLQQRCPSQ
jgi:hypothetical protein